MEKGVFAKVGIYLAKELIHFELFFLTLLFFFLTSCASYSVTRTSTTIAPPVVRTNNFVDSGGNPDFADLYLNSNQATKGAVFGGAAGAIAGALTPGVGVFPGAAVGAVLGASYGSYVDARMTLEERLASRGVNVIILGDQILIVIPSARIFESMSSNLKPSAYGTLQMVTTLINRYTKILVKVKAYTDDSGAPDVDLALSQQQAVIVAKTLTKNNVNARILHAEGMGGSHLVSMNNMLWDSDNYRVEITFEKLYV